MKKLVSMMVMISVLVTISGCFSPMVYRESVNKVALRKAILANNQPAIQAIRLGDNGVGLGINVLSLEAITEQPLKQLGAALGDAALIWAGYEGVRYAGDQLNGSDSKDAPSNSSDNGGHTTSVVVNGDNNNVDTGNSEEEVVPP